jgi:hypothetical protein
MALLNCVPDRYSAQQGANKKRLQRKRCRLTGGHIRKGGRNGLVENHPRRWGQCRGIKAPGVWIQHFASRLIPWYRSFKSTFTFGQR